MPEYMTENSLFRFISNAFKSHTGVNKVLHIESKGVIEVAVELLEQQI